MVAERSPASSAEASRWSCQMTCIWGRIADMSLSDSLTHLAPEESGCRRILSDHTRRYPRMAIQDLYKLIFQASFGSEHAVTSLSDTEAWLTRELAALGSGPEEPMVDPISPH